jgi:hypothetical protein
VEPLVKGDPLSVGGYTLEGRLGGGGMGQVYLGRSRGGRAVAVKVVREEYAQDHGFRERFRREVYLALQVGGFWTAHILDADPDAASPWVASEYIQGPTLGQRVVRGGPLPVDEVRRLGAGLAEALTAIHAAGLVHRDVKPGNIILTEDGPRVIDFGISKALEGPTGLTGTGVVVGTPGYMSPEQALGRPVGFAGDVFSLGSVLAYAATGREPFGTGAVHALLYRVVHDEPWLAGLPADLHPLITACLHKDPEHRPTAAGVLERLGVPSATLPVPSATPNTAADAHPYAFDNAGTLGGFLARFLLLPALSAPLVYAFTAGYLDLEESESLLETFSWLGFAMSVIVSLLVYTLVALNVRRHTDCALRIDEYGVLLSAGERRTRLGWADIAAVRTGGGRGNYTGSGRFLNVTVTLRAGRDTRDVRFSFSCLTNADYYERVAGIGLALFEFAPEEVEVS